MKTFVRVISSVVVISLFFVFPAGAIQPVMKKGTAVQQAPSSTPVLQPQTSTPQTLLPTPVQQTPVPLTPVAPQVPTGGMMLQKLPNSITINPAHLQGIKVAAFQGLSPDFYAAWKGVVDDYNALSSNFPNFEQQVKNIVAASQACKTKNYSMQDMTLVGCVQSDTLEACSKKLYEKCMVPMNSQLSYVLAMGLAFVNLKEFATRANAEAYNSLMSLQK